MGVNATWKHESARGIDLAGAARQAARERDHLTTGNAHVAVHDIGSSGDGAIADYHVEVTHLSSTPPYATSWNSRPQPLMRLGSAPACFSAFHTTVATVS